jgi:arylsulfatase A-like enzyme
VTLDTTRRDVLSPYGGPKLSSPNIEKLAAHSTVFDNAWAVSPWTLPSHASLFAGVYPSRHGAGVHRPRLDPEFSTLAEAYRSAGYRTAGFAGGEMTASHWGVAQGFEVFYDPEGFETPGDRLTDLAQAWLEDVGDAPFFLFLNYFDPHADYRAPEEFENLFAVAERGDRIEHLPEWRDLIAAKHGAWRRIVYEDTTITRDALDYLRAAYLAEVAFMDHQLGRLFETLVSRGLYDDATIVLVADHGEFLGEGGYFSHSTRLEPELTAIPLIIKWPRQHSPERVVQLASHVDLVPTLLEVSRLPAFIHDGTSLTSAGREAASRRDVVFMEEHESRVHPLIGRNMVAPHLYGLQEDSARQIVWEGGTECAWLDDPAWEIVECEVGWRERMSQLEAFASTWRETDTEAGEESLSDDMRRRLEALGYVR